MKKILPVFMPVGIILAVFLVLLNTDKLLSSGKKHPAPTRPESQEETAKPADRALPPIPSPIDIEESKPSAPKAIVVEADGTAPSYSTTKYPFVNQPYKWKKQKAWSYRHNFSFNSDGTVSQDFLPKNQSADLHWFPNHRYSIILTDGKDWTVDVVFEANYYKFTARRREHKEIFTGKKSR